MLRSKSDIFNDYLHFSYSSLSEKGREGERWRGLRKGTQKGKENMGRRGGKEKRISEGVVEGGGGLTMTDVTYFPICCTLGSWDPLLLAPATSHSPLPPSFHTSGFPDVCLSEGGILPQDVTDRQTHSFTETDGKTKWKM